jgi:hypothetical protein
LDILNLSHSALHHPDPVGECSFSRASSPVDAAREMPSPHTSLVRYAKIYDTARGKGTPVPEAMALVDVELSRELDQRRLRAPWRGSPA